MALLTNYSLGCLSPIHISSHTVCVKRGRRRDMTGEELAGPPAPKLLRLLYFAGAGFICTVGINKWRELQRKSMTLQQQQKQQLPQNTANALE